MALASCREPFAVFKLWLFAMDIDNEKTPTRVTMRPAMAAISSQTTPSTFDQVEAHKEQPRNMKTNPLPKTIVKKCTYFAICRRASLRKLLLKGESKAARAAPNTKRYPNSTASTHSTERRVLIMPITATSIVATSTANHSKFMIVVTLWSLGDVLSGTAPSSRSELRLCSMCCGDSASSPGFCTSGTPSALLFSFSGCGCRCMNCGSRTCLSPFPGMALRAAANCGPRPLSEPKVA
mmetsp:Transcript_7342/g.13004  ORF Transcript_7342/g.13004 Transcript_7342/m.13004 type:complete len:237 (-) Transcript_7342:9-719(-)